jgi:DNA topoisomerase-2
MKKKEETNNIEINTNISDISVSDFMEKDYKDYALYVLEQRAISSVADGQKPVMRKILHAADKTLRNSHNKVSNFAGVVISSTNYHHGNVSCEDAIIKMNQEFRNNLVLLEKIGQFGSRLNGGDSNSSSRYISTRLHKNFDLIFKDKDLLEYKEEEGMTIEPKYYLPLIPIALLNGDSGIALGHSMNIMNRDPKEMTKDCISLLKNKKLSEQIPCINTFSGTFTRDTENHKKWYVKGILNIDNASTISITEIPPSLTLETLENHLDDLQFKKLITSWDDISSKNDFRYIVKMNKEKLSSMNEDQLYKMFKLVDIKTENFTLLDEHGKIKVFETSHEITEYFVNFRLTYYHKRKTFQVTKLEKEIKNISEKARFIKLVIDNKIQVSKKSKDEITAQLVKNKFEMIDDTYNHLLYIPIYNLSNEKYNEMLSQIESKNVEIDVIKKSDPKQTYITELEELYKKL